MKTMTMPPPEGGGAREVRCGVMEDSSSIIKPFTSQKLTLNKIPGGTNVADIGTKHLAAAELDKMLGMMGFRVATGRSDIAMAVAGDLTLEPAHAGAFADAPEEVYE